MYIVINIIKTNSKTYSRTVSRYSSPSIRVSLSITESVKNLIYIISFNDYRWRASYRHTQRQTDRKHYFGNKPGWQLITFFERALPRRINRIIWGFLQIIVLFLISLFIPLHTYNLLHYSVLIMYNS